MRQIVLDTETTGLEPEQGHRIIEIGCVELLNRKPTGNTYHQYLNPQREIDEGALEVHGITVEFLKDKPGFADIAADLMAYLSGAELVIHNAPFDVGFLDHELARLEESGATRIADHCRVVDTLVMAREMHPGQNNSLDALCRRYFIDNTQRTLHGALLDAEILADVYLAMTGGQVALSFDPAQHPGGGDPGALRALPTDRPPLLVIHPSEAEEAAHQARLKAIDAKAPDGCLWLQMMGRSDPEAEAG
ncbi:MAG: DNA polymerase III subunit epsilon [Gammaproteobacteria bacterium]|nr:DNA polymerase III subunit epsilon [Gammaproteobacteria bacterium]